MLTYVGKRLIMLVPMLWLVTLATFVLVRLVPANPALLYAGGFADPHVLATLTRQLGLNEPLPLQYWHYLQQVLSGTLGKSTYTGDSVMSDLLQRLPPTVELTTLATLLAILIGVPLGILAAATKDGPWDYVARMLTAICISMPDFWFGLLLIQAFYVQWHIVPAPLGQLPTLVTPPDHVTGFVVIDSLLAGDLAAFSAAVGNLVLPVLTLAILFSAPIAKQTRASLIEVLGSDYIRTARAYGLSRSQILFRAALRNALLPVLTMIGMIYTFLLGADSLIEIVFNWPGIGQYAVQAVQHVDYTAIQGVILTLALVVSLSYIVLDVLYALVDPRVRL